MHKEGSRIIHRMGVESFSARGSILSARPRRPLTRRLPRSSTCGACLGSFGASGDMCFVDWSRIISRMPEYNHQQQGLKSPVE